LKGLLLIPILSIAIFCYGQNFINNGTFEYGGPGVGFWIDGQGYNQLNPPFSGSSSAGNYAFVTNPQTINNQFFLSSGDHTSGTGKMMVIDGNNTGGQQRFWKAGNNGGGICNLTVGQVYCFSYWIRTVSNSVSGNGELADIGVSFNNASNVSLDFGTTLAPIPNFNWLQVRYLFTATNSCVNIELYNNNTNPVGNDFAIDDIQLTPNNIPLSFTYSVTQPNCEDPNSGLIVIYPTGGVEPYIFRIIGPQPIPITNNTGVFEFVEPGIYTIGLMDALGTIDSVQNVAVSSISNLTISPSDTTVCPGALLTFNAAGGNGTFNWNSNNPLESGFPSTSNSISVSPTINTIYEVSSAVNNTNLIFNGDFQQGNLGFGTEYSFYSLSNPAGAQRAYGILTNPSNWYSSFTSCIDHTLGDGTGKMMVIDGSTYNLGNDPFWCQVVAVEPNKDYLFSYWATSLTSSNPANIQVRINGVSIGNALVPDQNCVWSQASFVWNSGNNLTAEICLVDMVYEGIGNDFAVDDITLKSQNNCTEQVQVTMATNNPDYGVTYPLYGCINDGTINPIIGSNYISGGVFNSIQTGLNINPITGVITTQNSNSGLYQITYTAEVCGSFIPDTFDLQLMPIPNLVELTGGTYNCQNQSFNPIVLTATGIPNFIAYYTINDSIFSVSSSTNQLNLGTIPGDYQLDSISDLYCTNSISGAITIDSTVAPVTPIIQGDSIFCYNSTISPLTVTNASDGIRWYGNSGLTQFLGSNLEFLPNNQVSQTYFATQTINGCEGEAASFTITINPCDLIIPSAFTPNNDGDNDFWNINQLDIQYPENTVLIYNRWGEPIYESTTGKYADKPWDGKYKEALLPVGTYYYVIQLTKDNSIEPLNGIVTLILKK
jgi:gliding motility-associated-like protein